MLSELEDPRNSAFEDVLVECSRSTKVLAKTFLHERFDGPFTSLHDQIFELVDCPDKYVAIAAPRGIGKTTIAIAKAIKAVLFRQAHFIPYVGCSHDAAMLQTENMKREILSNTDIRKVFGSVKTSSPTGMDESFSKTSWVAYDHTLVMPRGAGQQIRGILFGTHRPDLFIFDDLEDPEEVANDVLRKKNKEWFMADCLKAISRYSKNFKIIYIDTLKHEDSLLQDLLNSTHWTSVRLELFNDNYEPTVPEFFSAEDVQREVAYHKEQGLLDVLYREYRNLPISTEDAVFRQDKFKYYREGLHELEMLSDEPIAAKNLFEGIKKFGNEVKDYSRHVPVRELLNVVLVDPAKTVKLHSADSAIVGIGVHRNSSRVFVRKVVSGKFTPEQLYDEMFKVVAQLGAFVLAVEVTSLNEFIIQPIEQEIRKRQVNVMFEKLQGRAKKEERIAQLAPYYNQGYIYHLVGECDKLEGQLLSFPRSKLWDVMDALAYFIYISNKLQWLFDPPNDSSTDVDDDYSILKNEKTLEYEQII